MGQAVSFCWPPKSPNAGGLPESVSPQTWGQGGKAYRYSAKLIGVITDVAGRATRRSPMQLLSMSDGSPDIHT